MKITKQVRISINVNGKYCWFCRFYCEDDWSYDGDDCYSEVCHLFDEPLKDGRCSQCIKLFGGVK